MGGNIRNSHNSLRKVCKGCRIVGWFADQTQLLLLICLLDWWWCLIFGFLWWACKKPQLSVKQQQPVKKENPFDHQELMKDTFELTRTFILDRFVSKHRARGPNHLTPVASRKRTVKKKKLHGMALYKILVAMSHRHLWYSTIFGPNGPNGWVTWRNHCAPDLAARPNSFSGNNELLLFEYRQLTLTFSSFTNVRWNYFIGYSHCA